MGFLRETSGRGKVGAGIAALFAVIAGLVALATPASAHHSNIAGSAQCITGDGTWRVSWTASTWDNDQEDGGHPAILVEYRVNGGTWTTVPNDTSVMPYDDASLTPIAGVGIFKGSAAPNFTGTIDFAPSGSDQVVEVRSRPLDEVPSSGALAGPWFWDDNFLLPADGGTAPDTRAAGAGLTWRNGNTSTQGATTQQIKLEGGGCQPPANPSVEIEDLCATESGQTGINILLRNTGGTAATFNVAGVGNTVVAANATATVFVPVAEDAAYSVAVTVGGNAVPGSPIAGTRDCATAEPSFALTNQCAVSQGVEGIELTLTNSGDQAVTIDVEGVGDTVVGPTSSVVVFVPVAENSSYSIDVIALGGPVDGSPVEGTRDCRQGVAGVAVTEVCATQDAVDGILLTLTNTGDDDLAFQVDGGSDLVVAAGTSTPFFVPIVENSTYAISVTSLGATVGLLEGTRDCRQAEVSVELGDECAEGGVEVMVTNAGDEDATVEVDGEETEVPAGQTVTVVVPVDENDDYSITVTFDGATVGTLEGTRNCEVDLLQLDAVGDCFDNVARIAWDVGVDLPNDGQTLTIRWYDLDGNLQLTQSGLPLAGEAAWPGIVVGPDGGAVDWPGWFQDDEGDWVQGDDGFEWARPTVRITFEVNPTSDPIEVDYPPAQPGCTDPPATTPTPTPTTAPPVEVEGVQNPRPLPRTGGESSRSLVVGLALLISGAGVVLLAADRRRAVSR